MESDAAVLWEDVLDQLAQGQIPPSTLAMLRSCAADSLDEEALHVSTGSRFVQRQLSRQASVVEEVLRAVSFQPLRLVVDIRHQEQKPMSTNSELTEDEARQWNEQTLGHATSPQAAPTPTAAAPGPTEAPAAVRPSPANPLVEDLTENDSRLTFDRFVEGPQNRFALDAAKQVANGVNKNYNPLFIYGRSGLGKTHLLRAIQNYVSLNDPSRTCVYRVATDFIDDYSKAMLNQRRSAAEALTRNYHGVDILIIDDIQLMSGATGTIRFFFDTFNYLVGHGKQIVMAADRTPSELGMGTSNFDERVTSRLDSGMTVGIQVPDYELRLELIDTFYERMREDARREHVPGIDARIGEDLRKLMAERAGTNIRVIEGFVQSCLMMAYQLEQRGSSIARDDIIRIAEQKWPSGQRIVTVERIQEVVEADYGVSHEDLVGSKRNKELMEPRHVAIWLSRELTGNTLADIGKKFGGRSHATIKHSIHVVDQLREEDRLVGERVERLREEITE